MFRSRPTCKCKFIMECNSACGQISFIAPRFHRLNRTKRLSGPEYRSVIGLIVDNRHVCFYMQIRHVISDGVNKLKSANFIMSDEDFFISMLWFQYWGENIPSFTQFRRF